MGIWTYSDALDDPHSIGSAIGASHCPFCRTPLHTLDRGTEESEPFEDVELRVTQIVKACAICGWWASSRKEFTEIHSAPRGHLIRHSVSTPHEVRCFGGAACLKRFDLSDLSVPIDEIRAYLTGKFEERFQVHPRRFEEVVASVFGDLGYKTRVTSYSGDNGIDVVLDGPDGTVVGVQVKRTRGKIKVEHIRSLAGALVYHGITRGVFVTTSAFQAGAKRTVETFADRGFPIRLIDAPRFFDALKIAQRKRYKTDSDDGAPFVGAAGVLLSSSSHPAFSGLFAARMSEERWLPE